MSAASHEIHGFKVAFREWERPVVSRYESAKAIFDRLLATLLLVVLSPVWVPVAFVAGLIALIVKLGRRPTARPLATVG